MSDSDDAALLARYRAASSETPPAAFGNTIRAAAAKEGARPAAPRRGAWRAPLALAASVVLGLGIVLRVAVERPELQSTAEAPAGAPPAMTPASPAQVRDEPALEKRAATPADAAASAEKAAAKPAAPDANRQLRAPDVPARQAASVPLASPQAAAGPRPFPATTDNGEAARADGQARPEDLSAPAPSMRAAQSQAPGEPAGAGNAATPARAREAAPSFGASSAGERHEIPAAPSERVAAPAARAAMPPAPPAASPAPLGELSAPARAKTMRPAKDREADAATAQETDESGLTPEQWLKRIIDLRRAGRHAQAEASLRRFTLRHPQHRIPEEARAPRP